MCWSVIRAGVLEAGTVALLRDVGLGARMDSEGHPHDGSAIAWEGRPRFFIDTQKYTGKRDDGLWPDRDHRRPLRRARRRRRHDRRTRRLTSACMMSTSRAPLRHLREERTTAARSIATSSPAATAIHGVSRPLIPADVLKDL